MPMNLIDYSVSPAPLQDRKKRLMRTKKAFRIPKIATEDNEQMENNSSVHSTATEEARDDDVNVVQSGVNKYLAGNTTEEQKDRSRRGGRRGEWHSYHNRGSFRRVIERARSFVFRNEQENDTAPESPSPSRSGPTTVAAELYNSRSPTKHRKSPVGGGGNRKPKQQSTALKARQSLLVEESPRTPQRTPKRTPKRVPKLRRALSMQRGGCGAPPLTEAEEISSRWRADVCLSKWSNQEEEGYRMTRRLYDDLRQMQLRAGGGHLV